jgi:hypothetical protein
MTSELLCLGRRITQKGYESDNEEKVTHQCQLNGQRRNKVALQREPANGGVAGDGQFGRFVMANFRQAFS